MATTRAPILHADLTGGIETSLPSHLVPANQWRTCHNMRPTPQLEQVPKKKVYLSGKFVVLTYISVIPNPVPGYGRLILFCTTNTRTIDDVVLASGMNTSGELSRKSVITYDNKLFYVDALNAVRQTDGNSDVALANAPSGKYLVEWYDHLVVGHPTFQNSTYPNRVMWSDLYDFSKWSPDATNEADFYDFVNWQLFDYPFTGVTGLAKLRGLLYVFTPTAIIPLQYVGKPKVVQVLDSGVVTRVGNTFPYGLAVLDQVAFFYDHIERNFFAFDGQQVQPIGEPVRQYVLDHFSTDPALVSRLWTYINVNRREIWWVFDTGQTAGYDQAIVFNYRLKRWFTASVEGYTAFCAGFAHEGFVRDLGGVVSALPGTVRDLGLGAVVPDVYGLPIGTLLRDEVASDATNTLIAQEEPVLESGDFHYGDISTKKEVDAISINAWWNSVRDPGMKLEVRVSARDKISTPVDWTDPTTLVGYWTQSLPEDWLNFPARSGKILRYRIKGVNARGLKVDAYEDSVYVKKAEK